MSRSRNKRRQAEQIFFPKPLFLVHSRANIQKVIFFGLQYNSSHKRIAL